MVAWPAFLLVLPARTHVRAGEDRPFTAAEAFPAEAGVVSLLVPAPVCGSRMRVLASRDGPTAAAKALPPAAGVASAGEVLAAVMLPPMPLLTAAAARAAGGCTRTQTAPEGPSFLERVQRSSCHRFSG